MSMNSDNGLIEQLHRLDEGALAEIYDRFSPELFRYAWRLLGEADLAEECVAETFSRFLQALARQNGPVQSVRAYLYRVAHNWITDHYRRGAQSLLPLDDELSGDFAADPCLEVAHKLEQDEVRRALAILTAEQRQVIVLRYLEDWRLEEISDALGKPVGAIKALQHRGLCALRRLLLERHEVVL
jgi:RNA polymerase sigma-70 factor (ECF subfamily)